MIFLLKTYLAAVYTAWVALVIWMIGGFDLLVQSLLCLMFIDYITGLIVGFKHKNINSKRAYKGLQKKFMVLSLVCGASLMHRLMPNMGFRTLVAIFYCSTELLSIVENVAKCGVPIPEKLKKALEQLREK